MPLRTLYAGPQYPSLEATAFSKLADLAGTHPESVLYLARNDHAADPTEGRWRRHGTPGALTVDSFDGLVADCYEAERYAGRVTHVDQPVRDRIVELAVENLDDPSNPLFTSGLPAQGLCQQVEDLLSLLEFADLHSPAAIRRRLAAEGLDRQAETVAAVARAFETVREAVLGDSVAETFRAERYRAVATTGTDLATLLPGVDCVVLGGYSLFSPLERQLVARITETWPTVALLPQVIDSDAAVGVDRGAERALGAYEDLDFDREHVAPDDTHDGVATARKLYRPAEVGPDPTGTTGIDLIQPETPPAELRHVARDIRERIAAGTSADDIGVVLPTAGGYHERLVETLEQYDVPAPLAVERSFDETALGEVVAGIVSLSRPDPPLDAMTALLANPLVWLDEAPRSVDGRKLARVASRLASRRLEVAYDHLGDDTTAVLRSLAGDARTLRDASLADAPAALRALLDRLGVHDRIETLPRTSRGRTERQAADRLDRVLESLAMTDGHAALDRGDAVERLERALGGSSLDVGAGRNESQVRVCGLSEATPHAFTHAYVLGLTASHFPSNPDRLAFTRPINEAHEDFQQADIRRRARYHFAGVLASEASLTLSVPERDPEGDPYVEADVVTELRRVTGIEPAPVTTDDTRPGTREDVQRSLARRFAHDGAEDHRETIDRTADAGVFDGRRRKRLQRGASCSAARRSDELTPHDGQLSPEAVASLRGDGEPYSPSRLETYAACGFKYYASEVLDIETPDEIKLEPDARARGGFIHDALERYYAELQSEPGDPIDVAGDRNERERHLLEVALAGLEERFDGTPTAFQREWLVSVFAGLGTDAENPYFGANAFGAPERGLFVRFLDEEFDALATSTARPAYLEARVGRPRGDESVLQAEPVHVDVPGGTVPIHGKVDRVDVVPGTTPTQFVVRDYKTGRTPSEADTLGGVAHQLPLYALLAEGVLDGAETVGGAYYRVKPPRTVSHRKGLVGSGEHASYHGNDDGTPLLRHTHPTFETHAAFRRFVERTLPERLGQLADGIADGRYHPTVLDPDDAGCRHCGYSDVCDVRPHRRRDIIDRIDAGAGPVYVPLAARDGDVEDALEVE
jgi:ATP-dependent helicase/nuclease subunit B